MSYVGAVDQGTTSTRFILFDEHGSIVASHQMEHSQIYPHPGWVEHDPMEILNNTKICMQETMKKCSSKVTPSDVKAIGITNQRETTIVWDRHTGKPLHNAIVWLDTRTSSICDSLTEGYGIDRFRDITGLPISTYFSGMKLKWLLEHVEGLKHAAHEGRALFGTVDSWLTWCLTGGQNGGVHVTDVTNASRCLLMNIHTMTWNSMICTILGVPMEMLPEIRSSSEVYGHVALADTGLQGVPIAGILGDQQAATVGQGCFAPGHIKNTYGTGCFMIMNTGSRAIPSTHGLLTIPLYKLGPDAPTVYGLEGSVAIAGAGVQWLRDNLKIISSSKDVEAYASAVPDTGDVYFVPAFSGLYAPRWRRDARGTIVGMTQFTTRDHICRAVLESVCWQTYDLIEAMAKDADDIQLQEMKVDGGMTVNNVLMQLQADILGRPVLRPKNIETTAMGAAFAAGRAVGVWTSEADLKQLVDREFQATITSQDRAERYARWTAAVERSLNWVKQDHYA
eukprot:TRINITY_DN886_c0_g1::TRINITY_DN886_c0_g1_i1::g.25464::m.25464 TRINITY_DN886_c0_g1::TRINITY_DN886_c0_g1_i1::g.25464  ORF type:complete len:508 (+),score=117.03,sp/C5C1C4/GLPK_BEUC1/54.37/0.0,FGGY_N/PF00370.16/3.3e-81,FGGY_C/PF02782.11/7.1e+03,FGGY_C/PF02782.11/7.9e-61,BcrAD_BadFG/PF01869.15/0.13,BcrAD_BadFG/PF01869.15/24 TRINITY_DN886_c0_g1_i1:53-1576(+)